jgi:peptidyl-prolyl cis-trans isomerase D
MITWMQKHRKYMLVTMWVAVITFIGAGAVDWGGASYSSSASSVAKVGNIEVSNKEFARLRGNMFEYYKSQMKGEFTEEMAKQFQLDRQVLNQLIMKALTLNLAQSFDLSVSDAEVIKEIQQTPDFQRDGKFDISKYKSLLKRIRFQNSDYEAQVRQALLSAKVMKQLQPREARNEVEPFLTAQSIADKINYKILDSTHYKVNVNDKALKAFWSFKKDQFMTSEEMKVAVVTQKMLTPKYEDHEIEAFYNKQRREFVDKDGKVRELKDAKADVIAMMNDQDTEKAANYLKVKWKNFDQGKKDKDGKPITFDHEIKQLSFKTDTAPMGAKIVKKLKLLPAKKPYLKAEKVGNAYKIYKLISVQAPRAKSFEEAKMAVTPLFIESEKKKMLQANISKEEKSFKGSTSPFLTAKSTSGIKGLNSQETTIAMQQLFKSSKKSGAIAISNTKVLLYDVKEQKLLLDRESNDALKRSVQASKNQAFQSALIQSLDKAYPTINYLQ